MEQCSDCRFHNSVKERDKSSGSQKTRHYCRRFPPILMDLKDTDALLYLQPNVKPRDWCGEYQPSGDANKPRGTLYAF